MDSDAAQYVLMYFVLPCGLAAGFADDCRPLPSAALGLTGAAPSEAFSTMN
jgi:hypothetical protein